MSEKKKIQIHPDLLFSSASTKKKRGGGGGAGGGGDKSIKIKSNKNKTTKSKLLRYIREKQEENYKKLFEEKIGGSIVTAEKELDHIIETNSNKLEENMNENINSDFDEAIEYLKNMEIQEKEKKANNVLNRTIKNHLGSGGVGSSIYTPKIEFGPSLENIVNTIDSNEYIPIKLPENKPPSYGCLKGGALPTYRMYNQTQKNTVSTGSSSPTTVMPNTIPQKPPMYSPPPSPMPIKPAITPPIMTPSVNAISSISPDMKSHIDKLRQLSEKRQTMNIANNNNNNNKIGGLPRAKKPLKQKRTVKRTFYLGKSKVHPKVAVLVSNKTVRRNVNKKTSDIKQISINEIRRKLVKGGFIKVGSSAPNDVLRKMYESIELIGGEIKNHNPENLLYNYFNDVEK